jgi:hypothetical protein
VTTSPYATLLSFTRYVGRTGPGKARFVGGLRRQRESGAGFNPHAKFVQALKADIGFHTGGTHLREVATQVNPRWRALYEALTPGALRYVQSLRDPSDVQVTQAHDALGVLGGLTVKVNPHFALRYPDGRAEVIRLHLDEEPPSPETIVATLHLMARHMEQMLPKATPVLVDVRRGAAYQPGATTKPADVERWLAGEAAAFSSMWAA